jgi:serine/threonine protein kinase
MTGSEPPVVGESDRPSARPGGSASLVGTMVGGRYRIDSILGEGGMGTVYAAEHALMRKRVALKVLHPVMSQNPDMVARFEREAMAAGHIDHPNIAGASDFGQLADGSFFLVLELIEGENLREVIARGRLPVERAVHIGKQIANALSRAHALGVVHRDLKPDNVMLITRGEDPDFVKVLDFGIAKVPILELGAQAPPSAVGPTRESAPLRVLTQVGMIYGTPEYMAPEQALGQPVDNRADLYAVGILLFEMITGRRPFEHDNTAVLLGMHVAGVVPAMSVVAPEVVVPSAIEAVIRRLLAKDPAQRFASASELEEALAQAGFVSLPTAPPPPMSSALPVPPALPPWALPVAGAGVFAILVLGLASFLLGRASHSMTTTSTEGAASSARADVDASSAPAPSVTAVAEDPLAPIIAAAEVALQKKSPASAIALVAPIAKTNPERVDVHRVLERAYGMSHERVAALREAEKWLTLDPTAVSDLGLQTDVGEAATHADAADLAVAVLAARLGAPGVDILYDLAYAPHEPTWLSHKAKVALARPELRAHAGPAAAILLDLRAATSCESKHALLSRAKADGDHRALVILQPLASTGGCGFVGRRDCNPCLHRDGELTDAIAAVRGRAGML